MSLKERVPEATQALCAYSECQFCVHRVNASHTANSEGQCALELRGIASVSICKGRIFFSLSPEKAAKYRSRLLKDTFGRHPDNGHPLST